MGRERTPTPIAAPHTWEGRLSVVESKLNALEVDVLNTREKNHALANVAVHRAEHEQDVESLCRKIASLEPKLEKTNDKIVALGEQLAGFWGRIWGVALVVGLLFPIVTGVVVYKIIEADRQQQRQYQKAPSP